MKPRYQVKRRRGHDGLWIRDTLERRWSIGFGDELYIRRKVADWNAKERRARLQVIHGNDWALPNPDKSPSLSVIVGGAA